MAYVDIPQERKTIPKKRRVVEGSQVICSQPHAKAMAEVIDGLGLAGKLLVVGAPFEPMELPVVQ